MTQAAGREPRPPGPPLDLNGVWTNHKMAIEPRQGEGPDPLGPLALGVVEEAMAASMWRMKECRRIAPRFEKLAVNFQAMLSLAMIAMDLRLDL